MKYIRNKIGLALCVFGIKILESMPYGLLDDTDKNYLKELWKLHDEFKQSEARP
jgi:hypothetical protein